MQWWRQGILPLAITKIVAIQTLIALASANVIWISAGYSRYATGASSRHIGALCFGLILTGATQSTLLTAVNTIGQRGVYVIGSNVGAWLAVGVGAALIVGVERTTEFWLLGLVIGQTVNTAIGALALFTLAGPRQHDGARLNISYPAMLSFAWPLLVGTGLYWVQNTGYRLLLGELTSPHTLGLVATSLTIGIAPIAAIEIVLTEYVRPAFYREIADASPARQADIWIKFASAYLPYVAMFATFIAAAGGSMAPFLVGPAFQDVGWLPAWGAATEFLLVLYSMLVTAVFALGRTQDLILPNAIGAVVIVSGMIALVPHSAGHGAGLSLAIGMFATTGLTLRSVKRHFRVHFPIKRIVVGIGANLPAVAAAVLLQGQRPMRPQTAAAFLLLACGWLIGSAVVLGRLWSRKPIGAEKRIDDEPCNRPESATS